MINDELKTEGTGGEEMVPAASAAFHSSFIIRHSSFHQIRLGPPWQVTAGDGGTRHARKFGRPRTLDANERLWLVCAHVPGPVEVHVNGTRVGGSDAPGPFAADVTARLNPRNEAVFTVASAAPLGAVALEIRPA